MGELPGVPLSAEHSVAAIELLGRAYGVTGLGLKARAGKRVPWPSATPITVDATNAQNLVRKGHYVTEKTDGMLMVVHIRRSLGLELDGCEEGALLMLAFNRAWDVHVLSGRADPSAAGVDAVGTVLEGELVAARDGAAHFAVFDTVAIRNKQLRGAPYSEAYAELVRFFDTQPLRIDGVASAFAKQQRPAAELHEAWEEAQRSPWPVDGLVLTPDGTMKERFGTWPVLKLKHTVTIDLQLIVQKLRGGEKGELSTRLVLACRDGGTVALHSIFQCLSYKGRAVRVTVASTPAYKRLLKQLRDGLPWMTWYSGILEFKATIRPCTREERDEANEQCERNGLGMTQRVLTDDTESTRDFGYNLDLEFERARPDKSTPNTFTTIVGNLLSSDAWEWMGLPV